MTSKPTDFGGLLERLLAARVEFILVGGVATIVHGSARATFDVDIVYRRSDENISRLVGTLGGVAPYLRGAPPGLPFVLDAATIRRGLNFTLTTALGDIDLLGDVAGGGTYEELLPFTTEVDLFGHRCRCVTAAAPHCIEARRAARAISKRLRNSRRCWRNARTSSSVRPRSGSVAWFR